MYIRLRLLREVVVSANLSAILRKIWKDLERVRKI